MIATVSTHNGHVIAAKHNRRDPQICKGEPHIDLTRPSEIWADMDIEAAYHLLFDTAQARYNEKQKRADRRINNYYDTIRRPYDQAIETQKANRAYNDQNRDAIRAGTVEKRPEELPRNLQKPAYELIAGVYAKEQRLNADGSPVVDANGQPVYDPVQIDSEEAKQILREYYDDFQRRNGDHLFVYGCYYHDDEQGSGPHIHIDYIPVATGYSRGMDIQVAADRCFRQMGFAATGRDMTAQKAWNDAERARLDEIAAAHGYDIIHPQAGKNTPHRSKDELHAAELERDAEIAQRQAEDARKRLKAYQEQETRARNALQGLRRDADQDIADYLQELNEIQIGGEVDRGRRGDDERVIRAAQSLRQKDGTPLYNALLDQYNRRPDIIPRTAADAAHIKAYNSAATRRIADLAERIQEQEDTPEF